MNKLIKEFPRAFAISVSIFFVMQFFQYITGNKIQLNYFLWVNFCYTLLYGLSLYYANAVVFIYLDSVYKTNRFSLNRLIIGFISTFFITIFVIFSLRIFEDVIIEKQSFQAYIQNEKAANFIVPIILFLIVSLAIHSFYFYKALQENKIKVQKIIAGTANAKFESLKNQIDPHFLFNSLNVLSSLIEENPENAQRFTTSLSKVYRYVLEQKDKELVPIEEELAFAKTYMNLLKMRFENSLSYELPTNNDRIASSHAMSEMKVVPLSLQLLLENAVKHNVISEQRPLHIRIFIDYDYLVIQNNCQKKEVLQERQGVGLGNIINRYGIVTNRKVIMEQNQQTYTVKIPILTKQINIMENVNYNENSAYYSAKGKVDSIKRFYTSLISYCVIMPFLVFINLKSNSGFQWFWFPAFGWGFGLVMKALRVYGYSSNWEERKIQEILKKENPKQNWK